ALRSLYLIETEQLAPNELLVVTFTRKAAAEIGERIRETLARSGVLQRLSAHDGRGVTCSTIHSLASAILHEFAYDAGLCEVPRGIGNAEARAVFNVAFRALLDGRIDVDTSAFPLAEFDVDAVEEELGDLALRLKALGIMPDEFETNALAAAQQLAAQNWGQLWSPGRTQAKPRVKCDPKDERTPEQRSREAAREATNVRLVAALLRRFDEELRSRGTATYGDLILWATRLIEDNTHVARRLRQRWKYALVDEFQDTSETQMRFLNAIFGPGPMMPVGDFRQSIYAFNGADPEVMRRFRQEADETYELVENRRSHQEIVDAAHHMLLNTPPSFADDQIPKLQAFNGPGGIECLRVQTFVNPAGGAMPEHVAYEADAIANEIAALLNAGAQYSDVAILLRQRTYAQSYVKALNARNIPVALDQRSGLLDAPEIRDVMAWFSLLVNVSDTHAAARVLQSRVVGLNDASMARFAAKKDWLRSLLRGELDTTVSEDARARIGRFRALLESLLDAPALPLTRAVRSILVTCPIGAAYAQESDTRSAQALANLCNLEVLAQHFVAENPDARLADFVEDLQARVDYDDDTPEAKLDFDGVQILTVHRAKGLEWPYVFVACASMFQYAARLGGEWAVRYDERHKALAIKRDIDGIETLRWTMSGGDYDPMTGQRLPTATRSEAAKQEQTRVFYVAMTRAKRRLYISAPAKPTSHIKPVIEWALAAHGIEPTDLHFAGNEFELEPAIVAPVQVASGPRVVATNGEADGAFRQASLFEPRISFTAISTHQTCPRLARYRYRLRLPDLGGESTARYAGASDDGPPKLLDAGTFGSLVHRALELWGQARIDGTPIDAESACAQALGEFADVPNDDAERAQRYVEHAVAMLDQYEPLAVELKFETVIADIRVEGVIDLIARSHDGAIAVIDYKTGKTEDAHYALQLELYRRIAEERYAAQPIAASILRLNVDGAHESAAAPLEAGVLEGAVRAAGLLEDDTPRISVWCQTCSYRNGPCDANIGL
ncbi:MAG: ATP-dependent helicase, partial [Burkholderiales bacterium]